MTFLSNASQQILDYSKRPRILYAVVFFWNAWTGGRFTAPFLQNEVGFNDSLIGLSMACQLGLAAIVGPLGGSIADRRQLKHKHGRVQVLCAGLTLGSVAMLLHGIAYIFPSFSLLSPSIDENEHEHGYHNNFLHLQRHLRQWIVLWHFSLRLVFAIASAIVIPVLDGLTLAHLQSDPKLSRADYGKERLHGAVWWSIANIILGPLIDWIGFRVMLFTSVAVLFLAYASIFFYTKNMSAHNHDHHKNEPQYKHSDTLAKTDTPIAIQSTDSAFHKDNHSIYFFLKIICGSLCGASFLLSFFILNAGTSVVENLIFLFFEYLGGSNTICGLTVTVTVIFEIPIFHYAPLILREIGPEMMQQIACLAYVTRVFGYSVIPKNHMAWILCLEPLHGVTYAFSQTSGVEYFARFMPSGYEARGQGIMSIFRGLGSFVGLSIGGQTEQTLGPRTMYREFAVAISFALIQFGIISKWTGGMKSKTTELPSEHESIGELTGLISGIKSTEREKEIDLA